MSEREYNMLKQKQFKEMCIRIGMVNEDLKPNYDAIVTLMVLGKMKVRDSIDEKYIHAKQAYQEDIDIMEEYIED